MKSLLPILILLAASVLHAQTPDATPSPGKSKYSALENEQAMYSPLESPWADLRANHAFETHLFNLLRVEVRLWTLHDQLSAQDNAAVRENADEIVRIIHAQILGQTADALPLLQRTPNKGFAQLLVHQLEAYPFEWKEEGSEELLPNLHKLIDSPPGKPAPEERVRRHRRKSKPENDG